MASITTTNSSALYYGMLSKSGYVDGYWYVIYSDGTNLKYVSNSDPNCDNASYGTAQTIKAGTSGQYGVAIFEGIYCHLFTCTPDSNPIKYRRGTCSAGSISWDTEVDAATGTNMRITSADIDDTGNLLIGYYNTNKAYVSRNDNKDGTWATTTGYPKQISNSGSPGGDSVNHMVKVLSLGSGTWLGLFCGDTGGHVFARYWNGASLAAQEQCTDVITSAVHRWDARAYGSKVVLAWNGQPGNFYLYRRERSGGAWGTTVTMATMGGSDYDKVPAVCVNKDSGDFFVAWQGYSDALHVYYQKYDAVAGTWGSTQDAATETGLPNKYQTVGLHKAQNNSVLFFYLSGASPWLLDNLRIASLTASAGGTGPSGGCCYGAVMII